MLIVRSKLLLEDGYVIDRRFPFYYNDVDICARIHRKGYKIYFVPSAEVLHEHGSSFKKTRDEWKIKEYLRSQIAYFRKYYSKKVILLKLLRLVDSLFKFFLIFMKLLYVKERKRLIKRMLIEVIALREVLSC